MESLKGMWQRVRTRHEDDRGASLVEYALLVALIAVVCIVAIGFIGTATSNKYSVYNDCVSWAGSDTPVPANCR